MSADMSELEARISASTGKGDTKHQPCYWYQQTFTLALTVVLTDDDIQVKTVRGYFWTKIEITLLTK